MALLILRAALGVLFFCFVSWCMSSHKQRFPWRVVAYALLLQVLLAWAVNSTRAGRGFFQSIADLYQTLIGKTAPAARLVFGPLADAGRVSTVFGADAPQALAFLANGLVIIIIFSALMSVLYHLGVMQLVIWAIARVMAATMGTSGAESMVVAANIFVGQTEAPLIIRPYVPHLTLSELNAMMTGGFATIAGSVMGLYMGFVGPELAPHLLTASVLSAPAAFLVAKIMQPETETPETGGRVELRFERQASNLVEAAANGTTDGLKLYLNVIAMLIAFITLIHVVDWPLEWLGEQLGLAGGLSLARLLGWCFAPIAWIMGVDGWHDCQLFGSLLGTKLSVNELVAYQALAGLEFEHHRSAATATYALCGFANFASIGIQIGGLSALAEDRRKDIARLALRAMLGGAFASWITAVIAGPFV